MDKRVRVIRRAFSCTAILFVMLVTLSPSHADAQTGWSLCPNTRILDSSDPVYFPVQLPAGVYEIEIEVGDDYPHRPFARPEHQLREQVRVVLETASGNLRSAPTPDLPEGPATVSWQGTLGQLSADSKINTVRVEHIGPRGGGANSLNVNCIWIYRVVEIPQFAPLPAAALVATSLAAIAFKRSQRS